MWENLYSLRDTRAEITLKPLILERNDVVPVRQFKQLVNDEKSMLYKHAAEYDLVQIGRVNIETLETEPVDLRVVANGKDLQDTPETE